MSFVSYAQNFEDVMLWRALKHVKNGFYIDIGAQHPVVDSVSLAFYEHGWRGVHVEPTLQYSSLLRAARPDESVFQLAIGNQSQQLTFFEFEDTGLSTADAEIARKHQASGFKCRETLVPILSLDALLQQVDARDIHWLKVDVEGLEKEVLESWQSSSKLPWVIVVESTRPLTQEKSHQEWEALLLAKGYSYVYFDGLNRFYISPDHPELSEAFDAPPNFFDGFVLSETQPFCSLVSSRAQQAEASAQQAETRSQQAEASAQQAETKSQQAEASAQQAEAKAQQAESKALQAEMASTQHVAQLQAIYASSSWKVTRPLRVIKRLLTGDFSALVRLTSAAKLKAKKTLRPVIVAGIRYVNTRPVWRNRLKRLVEPFPALRKRLIRIALNPIGNCNYRVVTRQAELPVIQLITPRARKIYQDLKNAIEKDKGAI
ncbi:FkbM family methyltransferase [Stutzerimonas stutzeri]|uniref:FkbM family methyltransferase n=1 Tax=Stutzerimonas stutzeri TaxID=316 RepID=UPI000F77A633|nr:FkbM family methyltransferase [Stutzerimonas stutzeri]RRW10433.1 FkbM family methyltransferase [Stutzerimonas stutzeri]